MSNRTPSPPLNYDYSVITSDTDHVATLLLDAKNEYNKQLISHLRQPIFNLMKTIYNTSENICHQENTPENVLMVFQDNLAQVPKWAKTRRNKEYDDFLKISKCDWFNELIKFTYVTHVKILTIVNKPRPDVKISISIPSGSTFYHSVCIAVARELWRAPFLFNKHVGGKYEYQKNMRQIEQIIDNSIDSCIRAHIPMKTILQDYLDSDLTSTPLSNTNKSNPSASASEPTKPDSSSNKQQPVILDTPPASKKTKLPIINNNDDLDEFINTAVTNQPGLDDNTDGLETVVFAQPDELVDELEIIETFINDDQPTKTPVTNLLDQNTTNELAEVELAPVSSTTNINNKATENNTNISTQINNKNADATSAETTSAVTTSAETTSAVTTSAETTSAVATSAETTSADATSAVATSAETTSADATSAVATSAETTSAVTTSADATSATNAPLESDNLKQIVPGARTNTGESAHITTTIKDDAHIEEFNIDSLPEINLESLTQIAAYNKPSTPEPPSSNSLINTINESKSPHIEKTKYIPLSDMNEPGIAPELVINQELKQPTLKKKIIVEDLALDGLDEVPLNDKLEEMRTFKKSTPKPEIQTTHIPAIKEFAFF